METPHQNSHLSNNFVFSIFERLEDRVLFDGVPDATFVFPDSDSSNIAQSHALNVSQSDSLNSDELSSALPRELIVVDAGIEDSQLLLQSLLSSDSRSVFEIRLLDSAQDGIKQITSLLNDSDVNYDAVHILSHGDAGSVALGSTTLSNQNVPRYMDDLASWSEALTDQADILFYGCELAGNEEGQSLIQTVSSVTGADVAASTDLTGAVTENADWNLEYVSGRVETIALSAPNWNGTLAIEAVDGVATVQDAEFAGVGVVSLANDGSPEVVTTVGTPIRVGQMLERVWQFNETADVGRSTFVLDVSGIVGFNGTIAAEFGLIISDQPDLSGPNTTTLVASGYDAANGLVYFHQVDLDSGDFFGFATEVVQDNFTVSPAAVGPEDTAIDLGLVLYPALTSGGKLRDIIATDTGFRASNAGAASTDFLIPAGTTGIKITGLSTRDIGTSASDVQNDDYQRMIVSIDLDTELSNGFMSHLIDQGPSRSDQYGWSEAPLGSSILSGGGIITGDADDNIDPIFTIVDGVLEIVENHQLQTAYHVEFLTNATSSADFIQTATDVRLSGDQTTMSIPVPAGADFLVVNMADTATSSGDAYVEYKGNSRVYIDLTTLKASGVVAAERGETDNRVVSYAFEDYDVSSAATGSITNGATSVVGDIQETVGVRNDNQIYIDGSGNLVIDRNDVFATSFNTMVTVEYYDRKDVGSSAAQLGESTAYGFWDANPGVPPSVLEFDIPDNATLGILNLSQNGTRTNDTNENMGGGFAVIDLAGGTSSGSLFMVRAGGRTDLVGWDQTDFGTVFFDDPNTISNHAAINNFVDKFAGNAVFNLTNGGSTLELSTFSNAGTQTFLDYYVSGQIEWYGNAPLEISGFPANGSFDVGTLNPVTGNWDLTLSEAQGGIAYIPPTHVSGTMPVDVTLIIGDEMETTSVRVEAVIDPISFTGIPDACGDEDTDVSISANITPIFIDQDGSETVTSLMLSNIPVGHTISDGTNSFTATVANQSLDITAWNQATIVYRANPDESGTFTIDLDVNWQDVGGGVTDTDTMSTTFNVVVKPVNDPPVAVDNNYTILGNTTLVIGQAAGLLNNDTDADNDSLTVNTAPVSGPSNGSVTISSDGSFTYVPATGFSGTDSFEYEISDGNGGFDTASAYIDVSEPVTGPLNAVDDGVATNEETLININVMSNDALPTTGAFNIQSTTPPSNGSIVVLPVGTIDYTPDTNFFGTDTFTYTLADASGRTSTATVTVTVLNVQDPPVANADSGSTPEDTTLSSINILGNDSDPDNDTLTVTTATAANGTVAINGDGTIDYTPNLDFNGTDTINYTISDGNGGFASSIVLINVVPVADPPTSADHTVKVDEDGAYLFVAGDFAFADADPADSLVTIRIDTLPADGQLLFQGVTIIPGQVVSLSEINASKLVFVPDADGFGPTYTTFDFSVSDGALYQTTPNTMTVNVCPLQDPPVATDNSIKVSEDSTGNLLGLVAPTDVDGDILTATVTGLPTIGAVFLSNGTTVVNVGDMLTVAQLTSLVYDAPTSFTMAAAGAFTYDISDGIDTDTGEVDICITPVNDSPEIDLNGAAVGFDHADTFPEGGAAVGLTAPNVALVDDDDTTFPTFKIDVDQSTIVDAGVEFLTIGGTDFQLDAAANSTTTVTVGVVNYDVSFDAATGRFDIDRSDSLEMSTSEVQTVLADVAYRNDSPLPTVSDRVFDVCVSDGDTDSNVASSTISIVRDSEAAQWSLVGVANVIDGNNAAYTLALSAPLRDGETASVDLALADIDTNSSDYTALNATILAAVTAYSGPGSVVWNGTTLTFTSDGTGAMTPLAISLPTTPDAVYEGDEDYTISLSNPTSTTGETITLDPADSVTTTVVDNIAAPTVSISNGSATEGSPVEFTISLDVVSFEDIVLDLAAATGSATAATDFETTNFEYFDGTNWVAATFGTQITIPAGTTSLMVRVDSVQDGDVEPDETFALSASVVSGTVTNSSDTGTGAIINDDVALIAIDDVSVDEDNGTMTFTISLDQAPTGMVSVDWATASGVGVGGAASGVDFVAANGTATFNPGVQTQTVTITINQDALYEGPETFEVNLTNASGGTIVDAVGVGTIFDDGNGPNGTDDDRPVISIDDVTATEDTDSHAVFTISLSNPSFENVVVSLALLDISAVNPADYGPGLEFFDGTAWQPVAGNVTIPAEATSLLVRTLIVDDAIADTNETYSLIVTQVSGATANSGDTGTGTILDELIPDPTLVSISGVTSVSEGTAATYTIAIDNTPITDVTITFTYTGTANGGTDYSGVASVAIPAGSTTANITIPTIDDTLGEPLESFTIAIDTVTGGSLEAIQISPSDFEVTTDIIDDDVPEISVNDVVVTEGTDPFAEFTVELSNPTYENIDFDISAISLSANGETVDYGILGLEELEIFDGTNWIPAASASFSAGTITILMRTPIIDDSFSEPVEEFEVTATVTSGATSNGVDAGIGTIRDDMANPETVLVSLVGPPSVVEGATTSNYTLALTDPFGASINAAQDVTVTLTYTGTAADGSDFTGVATVFIPLGSGSATFTLPTVNDSLYEDSESIIITIDSVAGGGFEGIAADSAADTVTTLITDTADIPTVSVNDVTAIEGTDNFAIYTIELSNLSVENVDVDLMLADGTALGSGVDFGAAALGNLQVFDGAAWVDATTATIPAGQFSVQVRVPIVDDPIDEPTEDYTLTVDVIAGTTTNIQVIGTGTIIDDDPAPDVTIDDATAAEGDPLAFLVTLSSPSSQPIVLDFAAADTTATGTTDYDATAFEFSNDGGVNWLPAVGGSEVTMPANSTSVLVRVQTTEDLVLESTETMQISIASVAGGLVGNTTDTAIGTIIDDDSALVCVTANDAVAGEPSDNGQFIVTMTNPSDSPTVIAYSVSGSASSGVDFTALSGTITLPAGVTSDTINLSVIDDAVIEGVEDVTITLTSITAGDSEIAIDPATNLATATISDDDVATWDLTGATTVNEGANATYNLNLTGTLQSGESATVELSITNRTTATGDYDSFDDAVTVAVGAYAGPGAVAWDGTTLTFTSDGTGTMAQLVVDLLAINDAVVEGVEDYDVSIANPSSTTGASISVDAAANTVNSEIQDTIDAVGTSLDKATWSIAGAISVSESQTTDYTVTIDATLQAGETATVEISLTHIDTIPADITTVNAAVANAVTVYNAGSQPGAVAWDGTTLTFTSDGTGPMGDLVVQVVAAADGFLESPEDYSIQLANAGSGTDACTVIDPVDTISTTINPDTTAATWSIGVDNGDDEGATVQYNIALTESFGIGDSVAVDLTFSDVDTNSSDYGNWATAVNNAITAYAGQGTLTFDGTTLTFTANADGDTMAGLSIDLDLVDDALVEGAETFNVGLSNAASSAGINVSVSATDDIVTTTINDTIGIGGTPDKATWAIAGPAIGDEGTNVQYTVSLAGAFGAGETAFVNLDLNDLSTSGGDYASIIAAVTAAAAGNADVVFDGVSTLTFTAPSDGATMADLVIDLGLAADSIVEGIESFEIRLSSAGSTTGACATLDATADLVTTTINDLTTPVEWAIVGAITADEGGSAEYTITLDGALGANETATVEISFADLTTNPTDYGDLEAAIVAAIAVNSDLAYDVSTMTLTYTAPTDGAMMPPIVIDLGIVNDAFVEGPEQYTIGLSNPGSTSGAVSTVSVTNDSATTEINDTLDFGLDPDQANWTVTGATAVGEGATAQYTIALDGSFGAGEDSVVDLALANVDTTSADYASFVAAINLAVTNYSGAGTVAFDGTTITFTATFDGDVMTDLVINLDAVDDTLVEGDEDYTISISNPGSTTGGSVILGGSILVTTTITDDDPATWSITGDATVSEGATAEYTITLAGTLQSGETATIDLGLADVDTNSADYAAFVAAVNTAIGARTDLVFDGTTLTYTGDGNPMAVLTVDLDAVDDLIVEGDEDYTVSISNAGTTTGIDVVAGGTTTVTTTITDNDTASWSITGDSIVVEGATAQYTVALEGTLQNGETATIDLGIANVDTTSADYAAFVAAVNTAIGARADLSFDGTTLTYSSDGNPMADLIIDLDSIDDVLTEGPEEYAIGIANPASTSGSDIVSGLPIDVTTTIQDNDSVLWSITGTTNVDEGGSAQYAVALDGILQIAEDSSVQLLLTDLETGSADYDNFVAAVQAAVAVRSDLAFDPVTNMLTATGTGSMMADLVIDLDAVDDTIIEGAERYQVMLANSTSTTGSVSGIDPANSIVTTMINDTVGDGGVPEAAVWSIGVDQTVPEGNPGSYELNLSGTLQAGEVVSVDLALADLDTVGTDYNSFNNAMIVAVANYSGPGNVVWNGTTLTFTSDGTGAMAPLPTTLGTVNDSFAEGAEDFLISLSNANSMTGAATNIDAAADDVVTTIDDTTGPGADEVTWTIIGDSTVDEGGTAGYTVGMINALAAGDDATTELSIGDVDTNGADYDDFNVAVVAAVANYNAGGNPGSVSWDGTTLTFTAAVDGDMLTGLLIDLDAIDDAFLEGPEVYNLTLANAGSNTGIVVAVAPTQNNVFTTIVDTDGDDGPAEPGGEWSLTGPAVVNEGDPIAFSVALSGNLQADEVTSVQLSSSDIETSGSDYSNVAASVIAAVIAYNGNPSNPGTLAWDGTFLTFNSDGTGPMNDLDVTFSVIDDLLVEGDERLNLILANPSSPSGLSPTLSPTDSVVTTMIIDNDLPEWSIDGPIMTSEGSTADFTVSLDGVFQAGEVVSVTIGLADIDTTTSDHGDLIAAVIAASAANSDVTFDPATGVLEFTAPADGATMTDLFIQLPVNSDGISEAPEDFAIALSNPQSTSGASPTIDPAMSEVTTTINGSPVLQPDIEFTSVDTPLVGNVLSNDSDPDGDVLTVTHVDGIPIGTPIVTDCGTVVMNPNGSYTFTPNPGFFGVDTFTYAVTDSAGNTETVTVEITVNGAELGIAKSATDAVLNAIDGDNWDITFTLVMANLGNVPLNNLTLIDDVMSMFGGAFVSSSQPAIQNFVGSGAAPAINGGWASDTSQNILAGGVLEVGASFEVVFTVTMDPDGGGSSQALSNQASGSGQGINPDGSPMLDSNGDPAIASDVSDDGSDPVGENGSDNGDGVFGNDATQIVIADLGIAKSIVGEPVLLFNGNYVVTYQIAIENTGTVDLASLSLLEDLTTQFGGAFVNAGNLILTNGPSNPASGIAVDSGGFNGSTNIELMDLSNANVLSIGDSFTLEFTVEINPLAVTGTVGNQVSGSGTVVDENGDPITDSSGSPVVGSDLSDSGQDPGGSNPDDPNDTGSSSDVSQFAPPPLPLGAISGTVFLDENNDGIQNGGEGGIAGVEVTLLGTDVYGNPVSITVQTDSNGRYSFDNLNAGNYRVVETQPAGFSDGLDNGDSGWTIGDDEFSDIVLDWGQSFGSNTFAERATGTSGNPSNLPSSFPVFNSQIGDLLSSYPGGPGPIYSGIPVNSNARPLSLDGSSGQNILGGYSVSDDCVPCVPCDDVSGEPLVWTEQLTECEMPMECGGAGPSIEEGDSQILDDPEVNDALTTETCVEEPVEIRCQRMPFLKRFLNWSRK